MIVDTSAVVAILRGESDALAYATALRDAPSASISAATVLECALVLGPSRKEDLNEFLSRAVVIVPFDVKQLEVARVGHALYGRGSGSKAKLNFGDCFSYALAKVTAEPLLFKGDDFGHADIVPAI